MCERFTDVQRRECNGGQRCCIYKKSTELPSYDKGGHKARSEANQPNHDEHWHKLKNEYQSGCTGNDKITG